MFQENQSKGRCPRCGTLQDSSIESLSVLDYRNMKCKDCMSTFVESMKIIRKNASKIKFRFRDISVYEVVSQKGVNKDFDDLYKASIIAKNFCGFSIFDANSNSLFSIAYSEFKRRLRKDFGLMKRILLYCTLKKTVLEIGSIGSFGSTSLCSLDLYNINLPEVFHEFK